MGKPKGKSSRQRKHKKNLQGEGESKSNLKGGVETASCVKITGPKKGRQARADKKGLKTTNLSFRGCFN